MSLSEDHFVTRGKIFWKIKKLTPCLTFFQIKQFIIIKAV